MGDVSKQTKISLSIVLVLLGGAVGYGILLNRVDNVEEGLTEVQEQLTTLDNKIDVYLLKMPIVTK